MPTLEWIGKEKVINHHQDVPYRVLDKKYTYNGDTSENMIIHGDNLLALKSLLPQYEGRIDCIYIDPPYNTGNEKWVYNDNVNDPRINKWLGEVVGQEGEDLSRHDKWLCMMYPRLSLFAFLFGVIAVAITLLVAKIIRSRSNVVLLLSGIAVGGLMSSMIGLIKYLADNDMVLAEMTYWLLGDISGTTIQDVFILFPVVLFGCIIAFILSWRLNIVSLGAKEAKSLGVNYGITMSAFILIATVMTAGSVAIGGTIGWIGLVIPNIVKLLLGNDNRKVLPVSMLGGACFMIVVDMLARSLAPNEIPLSVITGILGTPLFILSIIKRRKDLK